MIKSIIKKVIPRKIISMIKIGKDYKYYRDYIKNIIQDTGEYDLLLGTPVHGNLGDHLIALAEIAFFYDIKYRNKVYDIPTDVYLAFEGIIKKHLSNKATVFINGGGWMGNLWPVEELNLQKMVSTFRDRRIIIFPQTIYYDEELDNYKKIINKSIQTYNKCDNLTLCLRDKASYDFAKKHYGNINLIFCPDIALSINKAEYLDKQKKNAKIAICMREDRESTVQQDIIRQITDYYTSNNYSCHNITTLSPVPVPIYNRKKAVEKKLREFAEYDLVISNRLHGMIFAFLANTPCVAFDNRTHKVKGVYDAWLSDCPTILFADGNQSLKDFEDFKKEIDKKQIQYIFNRDSFNELKESINGSY